jgi:hypothetical protein
MDMSLVRKLKKYRSPLPEVKLKQSLNTLEKTGIIDGISGAVNVGLVLDSFNNEVTRKKDREFINESNARNKYYAPLWKMAIEEYMSSSRYKDVTTPEIKGNDIKNNKKLFRV